MVTRHVPASHPALRGLEPSMLDRVATRARRLAAGDVAGIDLDERIDAIARLIARLPDVPLGEAQRRRVAVCATELARRAAYEVDDEARARRPADAD